MLLSAPRIGAIFFFLIFTSFLSKAVGIAKISFTLMKNKIVAIQGDNLKKLNLRELKKSYKFVRDVILLIEKNFNAIKINNFVFMP